MNREFENWVQRKNENANILQQRRNDGLSASRLPPEIISMMRGPLDKAQHAALQGVQDIWQAIHASQGYAPPEREFKPIQDKYYQELISWIDMVRKST